MTTYEYSEEKLIEVAKILPLDFAGAFCLACAMRTSNYIEQSIAPLAAEKITLLESGVIGADKVDYEKHIYEIQKLVDRYEDEPPGFDSLCQLLYTASLLQSKDLQNAAWCAAVGYGLADSMAQNELNLPTFDETRQLSHPTVQQELSRQWRDLMDLRLGAKDSQTLKVILNRGKHERIADRREG